MYAKRVAAETETEETAHIRAPIRKSQDETNDVQIEIVKGKEEKKNQKRKKEDSTKGEYAYFRLARGAGGCSPETK